jgi:2-polyprenyl-6-methoxyphenol hydroxylase-like FAD-dependent oxidoreductase
LRDWCATPIAGIGKTLAIVGAYVLTGQIAQHPLFPDAFERYDQIMRPCVEKGQSVPKIAPAMLQPQTRFGVAFQLAVLRAAAAPGIKQVATKFFVSALTIPNCRTITTSIFDQRA